MAGWHYVARTTYCAARRGAYLNDLAVMHGCGLRGAGNDLRRSSGCRIVIIKYFADGGVEVLGTCGAAVGNVYRKARDVACVKRDGIGQRGRIKIKRGRRRGK